MVSLWRKTLKDLKPQIFCKLGCKFLEATARKNYPDSCARVMEIAYYSCIAVRSLADICFQYTPKKFVYFYTPHNCLLHKCLAYWYKLRNQGVYSFFGSFPLRKILRTFILSFLQLISPMAAVVQCPMRW